MNRHRPHLIPAGLFIAAAFFLLLRPLACRPPPPLVVLPDSGPFFEDSGPDAGPDAGDGGYHADGGCDVVLGQLPDGGYYRGVVPKGFWERLEFGSCTYCDPALNPNGYTVLDSGEPCLGFSSPTPMGGQPTVPFAGVCGFEFPPFGTCGGAPAGSYCNPGQGFGCKGGSCNEEEWCEVDQNIAWFTACGASTSIPANACANGPCCTDGGYAGVIPDGGGWCCGLVDGGISTCFPAGNRCIDSSDCCPPLHCGALEETLPVDAGGFGLCE